MKILRTLLCVLVIAGCASSPKKGPGSSKSLYLRVGGLPALKSLVHQSVQRIGADPRVRDYFKAFDMELLEEHFIQFACIATGGPCKYEGKSMKESHENLHITNAAFDAVLEDILFTMKKMKVPSREEDEIINAFNGVRKDVVEIK